MKVKLLLATIGVLFWVGGLVSLTNAQGDALLSKLLTYDGKSFTGVQDPEYLSYDQVLREYVARRIGERFGVTLDPKIYSGFDLLEIEAFFRCKKPDEPYDAFLRMFPKQR